VTSDSGGFTADCKVYVVSKAKALKSITVSPSKAKNLLVGQVLAVKATLKPASATGKVPIFKSSDEAVAVIDSTGLITALSPGKTTITTKVGTKTKKFVLSVGFLEATKIALNKSTLSVTKGSTYLLYVASWTPVFAHPQTVTWKSSNTKIATVSASGVVTAKKKGTVTITATTWNGKTAKCKVTVK